MSGPVDITSDGGADYWEHRYQAGDTQWEKGEPSPGLVDFLAAHPELPRGSVCVPGCGTGHDARLFARAGFTATGLDFAPSAIQLATERTRAVGLSATFHQCDFLHDAPTERFDWLFEHTLFCAIPPASRDDYVRAVLRWLKPDGHYLAVNYFLCEPDGPPWPVTREEILQRFSPHFELVADWTPRSYPNRVGLERMFWWKRREDPKSEIRSPKEIRNPKSETRDAASPAVSERVLRRATGWRPFEFRFLGFGFHSDFGLRVSDFPPLPSESSCPLSRRCSA